MTSFCWLPPESVPAGASIDDVRMSNSRTRARAFASIGPDRMVKPAGVRLAVALVEHKVLGDGEAGHHPVPLTVLRDEPDRAVEDLVRRLGRDGSAVQSDRTGDRDAQPQQRLDQFFLAVALHAGQSQDLARAYVQGDPVDGDRAAVVLTTRSSISRVTSPGSAGPSRRSARRRGRPSSSASSASLESGRAWPTTLPRRITVILSAIALTSRSLWVMNTIDVPDALRSRMTPDQIVDLLRREHGGGLVEDQHLARAG